MSRDIISAMDLTFKNVARYVAENTKTAGLGNSIDLTDAGSFDAFSQIYLSCIIFDSIRELPFSQEFRQQIPSTRMDHPLLFMLPKEFDIAHSIIQYPYVTLDSDRKKKFQFVNSITPIDKVSDFIKNWILSANIDVNLKDVLELVPEITHNAKIHAVEPFYVIRLDYSESGGYLDVVIADIGLGIKVFINSIIKAFEPMVTSKNEPRGTGLSEAHDYFLEHEESLMFLSSNDGYYLIDHENGDEVITAGNLKYNLNGVQVLMRFGCE